MVHKVKVGDTVMYREVWPDGKFENKYGVVKEIAVRCGSDEYGFPKSKDDYMILEDGTEVNYQDAFEPSRDLKTIKESTDFLKTEVEKRENFNKEHNETLINVYNLKDQIAKNEVIIAALEYFETVKDDTYHMKVNDYINLGVNAWNGGLSICFWLSDKIEPDMYDYVWSSHSDLNTKTSSLIKEMLEFIFDFKRREWIFDQLRDKDTTHWKIQENGWATRGVDNLKEIVAFLTSAEMDPFNKMIIEYFDHLVAIGKKREEEGWY